MMSRARHGAASQVFVQSGKQGEGTLSYIVIIILRPMNTKPYELNTDTKNSVNNN